MFLNLGRKQEAATVFVPPPAGFRKIVSPISWVVLGSSQSKGLPGRTAAQKAGLRYEQDVQDALTSRFGNLYFPQQEIRFSDAEGDSRCFMDGLLTLGHNLIAVEVKSQHMPESWWQLTKYEQLLREWDGRLGRKIIRVEICKSLDAAMPYPEKFNVVNSIDELLIYSNDCNLGVFQWKL